jgi:transketolase
VTTEIVNRPYVQAFADFAANRPDVIALSADLTNSCELGQWRDSNQERFFSFGMAEQNMLGVAAGLAREGFRPFVHTFSVFIYRRPYDQLAMSIAYPNLPVRLIGFLPGITTPGGVTHQAIEDIAVLRAMPNMTILETADATDVETVLAAADTVDGPVYVRMLRGEVPRLFPADEPFKLGVPRILSEGTDLTIITAGITTEEAMRVTPVLSALGLSIHHVNVGTHKPFGGAIIDDAIRRSRYGVITLENHTIIGGLGSAVAELMAEGGTNKRLVRLGLRDCYAHGASRSHLMREYGLDAMSLCKAIEVLVDRQFGIQESDLAEIHITPTHSVSKAEAL